MRPLEGDVIVGKEAEPNRERVTQEWSTNQLFSHHTGLLNHIYSKFLKIASPLLSCGQS